MPFQSEKQRRYLWANEPEIARDWTDTYGSRIQRDNGGIMGWADQGGMKNYLGEQPMVNAPQFWRSGPDSSPTELAYITEPEKELILRSNMHGSLGQGPNEGPSGIMSLDSQGDYTRDRSPTAAEGTAGGAGSGRIGQERHDAHMKSILTGQQNIGQTAAISDKVRQGAVPEWIERPDGTMAHVGSAYKDTGRRGFLSKLFGGTNKYGYGQTYGTGSGRLFDRKPSYSLVGSPGRQRYVSTDPRIGQVKPGYGGRILGGLASILTGIPLVGGVIGSGIDYGKGIFGQKPRDMSQFQKLGLYGNPELEDFEQIEYYNQDKTPMERIDRWTDVGEQDTSLNNLDEIEGQVSKVIGPALIQMRVLEKKKGMSEYGGPELTPKEERILNELKEKDAEETVYKSIIT